MKYLLFHVVILIPWGIPCLAGQPDKPFAVVSITPQAGSQGVVRTASIQVHLSTRFDPKTISQDAVRLWNGKKRVAITIGSDLGGVVTLSPEKPLGENTLHRVELTAEIRSLSGEKLQPFEATFRTGTVLGIPKRTLPAFRKVALDTLPGITSIVLGPGDLLYASTWEGKIVRWSLDPGGGKPKGKPTLVWERPGTRITALCFDPDAERNHRLWIALDDNAGESVCELRFSARIVALTIPPGDADTKAHEFITGLPIGDHAVSGLCFDAGGKFFFVVGANTMLGGPKDGSRETLLSAAVLTADVRSPTFDGGKLPVDVRTDEPVRYDPYRADAPVRIFATGVREAYDLCPHSNGRLYAGVNQNDTAEKTPANEKLGLPALSIRADEPLIRIEEGKYYGHPNPARNEWVLLGGNPTNNRDPWEVPQYPVGTRPQDRFDPSLLLYSLVPVGGQSANGCAEYRGTGPLKGRMLVCFYTSARTIHTFAFSPDGTRVIAEEPLMDSANLPLKFGGPLDLAIDHLRGRIYVADFADPRRKDSAKDGVLWMVEEVRDNEP